MEDHLFEWEINYKWPLSIAMIVYQMVFLEIQFIFCQGPTFLNNMWCNLPTQNAMLENYQYLHVTVVPSGNVTQLWKILWIIMFYHL